MLAVSAVFNVVQIVAGLLAEQAESLSAGHMKLLPAAGLVALHAGPHVRSAAPSLLLADITRFAEPLRWYKLQNNRLHCRHVTKSNLRYVESANDVRPSSLIRSLKRSIPARAQLAAHAGAPLLRLALPAVPRARRYRNDAVASLVYGNGAALAIAVHQRVLSPAPLVRTHAAPSEHLLHAVLQAVRKTRLA